MSGGPINRQSTSVRAIERRDVRKLMRLIDTAWRVQLRISPLELGDKVNTIPGLLAEDGVGLLGFVMIEPLQPDVALMVGAGLRDTWGTKPFLDLLLPEIERIAVSRDLSALVYIGNAVWLVDELKSRGFEIREKMAAFERLGDKPPLQPASTSAQVRTAHFNDLSELLALDRLAFGRIWHKSLGNFNEALAKAVSFSVALLDDKIVAYEWCEIYKEHAHLTRLAVHPEYQGRGLGAQMLHKAITDALAEGADIITLNTQENNRRSRALYERFGFVDTKERIPVLWKDVG